MGSFFLAVAVIACLFAIVPLMVWGGTGSWRHAVHALKQYLQIMGALALVGGGLGVLMAIAEHGWGVLMLPFR